ncbi:MAG: AI-2E family transporter [Pseudomonadota bacterium]
MGLSVQEQARYWGIAAVIFFIVVWFMGQTLLPFFVGAAIAYCLDPFADRLEEMGMSRVLATAVITFGALLVFLGAAMVAVPLVIQQIQQLAEVTPQTVARLQAFLTENYPQLFEPGGILQQGLAALRDNLQTGGAAVVSALQASLFAVFDFLILLFVAPVVAFYLLLDWDRMIARIDEWLPREHAPTIRGLVREIDWVLGGFVRGQLSVCVILGGFYSLALLAVGLNFGLIVGLVAGLISFIPFIGSIVGGALSIGLALFQFWNDPLWIIVVAGIFVVGQMVEGNVLTPLLVGGSVGLHPVTLMFALSIFGATFGFVGLLVAVPLAAGLGVLSRFGLRQYLDGRLYNGPADLHEDLRR